MARFCAAWERHAVRHEQGHCVQVFESLNHRYDSDSRHYHDRTHIDHCIKKLDEVIAANHLNSEDELATLELAIWFHDAVYTAGDTDNEQLSASLFNDLAVGHLKPHSIDRINRLIEATEHRDMPRGDLEQLVVDIDLSSFSMDRHTFLADGHNIRQEFNHVSDADFVAGQTRFLQALLDRPSIYSTPYFRTRYEETARRNIEELLEMYRQGFTPRLNSEAS